MKNTLANWATTIFHLTYGIYLIWLGINSQHYEYITVAIIYLISGVGFFLHMQFSKYFIYLLGYLLFANLGGRLWTTYMEGWPYQGTLQTSIGLFPAILLMVLHLLSALTAYRSFVIHTDK